MLIMGSSRRLQKELSDLQQFELTQFRSVEPFEDNLFIWIGLLLPESKPYSGGGFKLQLTFPQEYPFKPPKLTFLTPIYHPNVSESGEVCLEAITSEKWKPSTKVEQVIEALAALINKPQPEHPLRPEVAEEYLKEPKKFYKNATEHVKKHGERRPN